MNNEQLDAIEARANNATPGPWGEVAESGQWYIMGEKIDSWICNTDGMAQYNIDFITHARTDIPALVAEVRRLRKLFVGEVLEARGQ